MRAAATITATITRHVTVGAVLVAVPVVVAALAAGLLASLTTATLGGGPSAASAAAVTDIPPGYLRLYQQAAGDCPGLDWTVLAAIGKIESDHGRSPLPGVTTGAEPGRRRRADATARAHLRADPRPPPAATRRRPPALAVRPARRRPRRRRSTSATTAPPPTCPRRSTPTTTPPPTSPTSSPKPPATANRHRSAPAGRAEQATVPDPSGTGGHVTPRTAALYHALAAAGALPDGATCWDPHLQNPDSDHPRGRACDVFFHPHDPADVARGWNLARRLTANQAVYGVHYLIWQGLIWSAEHPSWTTYQSPILWLPEPGQHHRLPFLTTYMSRSFSTFPRFHPMTDLRPFGTISQSRSARQDTIRLSHKSMVAIESHREGCETSLGRSSRMGPATIAAPCAALAREERCERPCVDSPQRRPTTGRVPSRRRITSAGMSCSRARNPLPSRSPRWERVGVVRSRRVTHTDPAARAGAHPAVQRPLGPAGQHDPVPHDRFARIVGEQAVQPDQHRRRIGSAPGRNARPVNRTHVRHSYLASTLVVSGYPSAPASPVAAGRFGRAATKSSAQIGAAAGRGVGLFGCARGQRRGQSAACPGSP